MIFIFNDKIMYKKLFSNLLIKVFVNISESCKIKFLTNNLDIFEWTRKNDIQVNKSYSFHIPIILQEPFTIKS